MYCYSAETTYNQEVIINDSNYRSLYHHFENGCFMADCQAVVEIKNDLIRTMGECRDVTDQYQTGRSAYLRLGQLFMRLFAGLL